MVGSPIVEVTGDKEIPDARKNGILNWLTMVMVIVLDLRRVLLRQLRSPRTAISHVFVAGTSVGK